MTDSSPVATRPLDSRPGSIPDPAGDLWPEILSLWADLGPVLGPDESGIFHGPCHRGHWGSRDMAVDVERQGFACTRCGTKGDFRQLALLLDVALLKRQLDGPPRCTCCRVHGGRR